MDHSGAEGVWSQREYDRSTGWGWVQGSEGWSGARWSTHQGGAEDLKDQGGSELLHKASKEGGEGPKGANGDGTEKQDCIGRGGKSGRLAESNTDLVLSDKSDSVLGGSIGDEGDLVLEEEGDLEMVEELLALAPG